ncbi:Serine-protein kinase ATM, partial [Ophiophagus hannah]
MNFAIHDLLTCCHQLGSDKAMERKVSLIPFQKYDIAVKEYYIYIFCVSVQIQKEIEKFRRLICDPETVQQLDRNSDSKHGKQMNWDTVFRLLQKYIQKEAESVRLAKPSTSASTQATREKKLKQLGSLVKYFIMCANKRAPRIKCQELLNYVIDTINESSRYAIYGADCNSILLKDILKVRKYWCEISPQLWSDLQNLYFKLFLNPGDVNKVLVPRIIYTLTRGLCFQTDKFNSDTLNIFSKVIHRARQERNLAGLEHIFAAINVFLPIYAMNYRMQVCETGEEILSTVLFIWAQYKPKDALKKQIIQFIQFQICVHHPNGAKTQEEGAYSSAKWQNTLYNLYDLLANEITLISNRGKYSSGSHSIVLKDNLVELMADSCHQVFTEDTKVLEVTQSYAVTLQEDGEGPSKRRRIELGWEVIQEHLQKSQNMSIINFLLIIFGVLFSRLQITTRLVSKYPRSLPDNELTNLLNILYQLLHQQRRGERTPYVLRCLKEVALCQSQKTDLNITEKFELQRTWSRIWSLVDRSLNFRQTEVESFELLRVLFQRNLITMDREIWRIFAGSVCKPSSFVVQCLASAMTALEIPETLKTGSFQNDWEGNATYILKEQVVKWLLFCNTEEVMEDSMELPPLLCSMEHSQEKEETSLSDIEAFYLQTTFNETNIFTNMADVSENKSSSCLVVNQRLEKTLKRNLMMMSDQLLSHVSPEESDLSTNVDVHNQLENISLPKIQIKLQAISAEILMRCTSILTGVLGCYCYAGILTEEEACKLDFFQKAKVELFDISSNRVMNSPQKSSSTIFLHLLTSKLMNDLASICKLLMFFTGKSSEIGEMDLMEDFPEESRMEEGNQTVFDLFDDECSEVGEVNEVGDLHTLTGATSPLSEEYLSKQDLLLLDVLKFLCIATTATTIQTVPFRCSEIWRKLLVLIDGNSFDFMKPLHLHVYLVLLKELPRGENPLPEDYVVALLKLLPDICSFYRRDQDVCAAILHNLLPMVNILGTFSRNCEDLREARRHVLIVVGSFWHLANEGKCSVPVRIALVNCMTALLHADPCLEWAVLEVKCENLPVRDAFPQFLADNNFQVCIIAAKSAISLFQDVKLRDTTGLVKGLPLKFQQRAFENLYIKVQEGAKTLARDTGNQESHPDEEHNRKTVLLMLITMILYSSPVCEKQALFAIFQCIKKNGLDPQLVRKVLENISGSFGYKNTEDLMSTHLDYLVFEWLNCDYSLSDFPYVLLNCSTLEEFYRSCYKILIPQLIIRNQFEEIKSIASHIEIEERHLLAQCFPKILVNILPYFAYQNHRDTEFTQKSNTASRVYDMLTDENYLGKQLIDSLFHSSLPEIVVEVLMTLHEPINIQPEENSDLIAFTGDLDPAPNPPYFPSFIIQATLDYINRCYKTKSNGIVAILSKNPESFHKILFAVWKQVSGTKNNYKKHRMLMIYHFFVNLLLKEIKGGLGGAWAFVLRDVIYSMIHHISNRPNPLTGVSLRSFLLCCDLLNRVCHTAVQYCGDALASHLHVVVGTLIPIVGEQPETEEKVLGLLKYLVIDNQNNEYLYQAIKLLDPFPDHPHFKELRATQQKVKYSTGKFSLLQEINHFLSINISDSLFLTRLEGLNDLHKQLEDHKEQIMEFMKKFQEAVGSCLGEIGPINFSTIALQHSKNGSSSNACDLFEDRELHIEVRSAAAVCLKNILATKTGHTFSEMYKTKTDTMLKYLHPFRTSKKKNITGPPKRQNPQAKVACFTGLTLAK